MLPQPRVYTGASGTGGQRGMSGRQVAFVAVMSAILAACGAGATPTPSRPAGVTPTPATASHQGVSPTPVTLVTTPTPAVTPSATLKTTPRPSPTPVPVPPKPTGLEFDTGCMLDCPEDGPGPNVTWTKPRTKGVEVRVYGVTSCFRTDAPDGRCLRKHIALPDDIRVLLAKGPASKGVLYWNLGTQDGIETDEGCTSYYETASGTRYYSVVVAAYNDSGHSIFGIAYAGDYTAGECGVIIY